MISTALGRVRTAAINNVGGLVAKRQPRRPEPDLERWLLSVDNSDSLVLGGVSLRSLVAEYGSPLHVISGAQLDANIAEATKAAAAGHGADVFFSYKTNPVPTVLSAMHAKGIGAEVISEFEYHLARSLGVAPDRIIYNGPAKSPASLRHAIRSGVLLINANSAADYDAIEQAAAEVGCRANVGIRIALPGTWAGQFGISGESAESVATIERALASPHVELTAMHVHRGVTMRRRSDVVAHTDQIIELCDRVRGATGWHPSIIDIGGSLACPNTSGFSTREFRLNRALGTDLIAPDPQDCITVGETSSLAHEAFATHARANGLVAPRVVLEPGRALVGNTQLLLTSVLDVKRDTAPVHAIVDAGINIAESVPNEFHQLFSVDRALGVAEESYRIAGPICTPADVLYNNWRLPPIAPGDVLAIMDTGAYCVPFSTSFSFPRPPIVEVRDGTSRLARVGETFDDLVRRDRLADGSTLSAEISDA